MSRIRSPGYPSISLPEALRLVRKVFDAVRRNPVDRAVAAKQIGFSGPSGAADMVLGALAHYGLLERAGKGETKVSQRALDILEPHDAAQKRESLKAAAFSPELFKTLRERFPDDRFTDDTLRSYLIRLNFADRALGPAIKAYTDTVRFIEIEGASESDGVPAYNPVEIMRPETSETAAPVLGGARMGDLVQWTSHGVLQFQQPKRVRFVSDDGCWIGVEGSATGIAMSEVTVEERGAQPPPQIPFEERHTTEKVGLEKGESEWMRNKLGRDTNVRLVVSGEMGPKEIGRLIKILEAQKAVLEEIDD